MATIKQKRLVQRISENLGKEKPQTMQEIMLDAGYTETMAKSPQEALKGKGVIQLFKEAGITPEKIAIKYNEILDAPIKEKAVSWDTRRKTLEDLSRRIIDKKEDQIKPQIQFIDKFLNVQALKLNRPKRIKEMGDENE